MKQYRKVWACAALVLGTALGMARAESVEGVPAAAEQPAKQGKVIQSRLDRLTELLRLSAEQRSQIAAILKSEKAMQKAVRADTSLTDDVRKAKRREIAAAHNAKIRELLNAEQQSAFDVSLQKKSRKS